MTCKHYQDEFCVNPDCPHRADYCPVGEFQEVCKYSEEETFFDLLKQATMKRLDDMTIEEMASILSKQEDKNL